MIAVFDSNIVIDFLNGIDAARAELARYERAYISPITWVEAQVKAPEGLEADTRVAIDSRFETLKLDDKTLAEALESVVTRFEAKVPDTGFVRQRRMN